jgi:hypothetical protein
MKFFIFLGLFLGNLFATDINEFHTDVYFVNGINNTKKEAIFSAKELGSYFRQKQTTIKYLYNWSGKEDDNKTDLWFDLQETFALLEDQDKTKIKSVDQLIAKISIEIIKGGDLILNLPNDVNPKFIKSKAKIKEVIEKTVDVLSNEIIKESLQKGHRVLLVGHSEGNLFANLIFDRLQGYDDNHQSHTEQNYIRIVSVGSPANHVRLDYNEYTAPYTTLSGDLVIKLLPGHLTENMSSDGTETDPLKHNFVNAYMKNKKSRKQIVSDIKKEIEKLKNEPSMFKEEFRACGTHQVNVFKFYQPGQFKIDYLLDTDGKVFSIDDKLIKNNKYATTLEIISDIKIKLDREYLYIEEDDQIFTKRLDLIKNNFYHHTIIRDNPNKPEFLFTDQYSLLQKDVFYYYQLDIKHKSETDKIVRPDRIETTDEAFSEIIVVNGVLQYKNIDLQLKLYDWNTGDLRDISIDTVKNMDNYLQIRYCYQ